MSSFFGEEDDSDVERAEKKRRILQSIRNDPTMLSEPGPNPTPIEEPEEQFSEEEELRKLRKSARYRQYAAARRKNPSCSPQRVKRPRSGSHLERPDEESERDEIGTHQVTVDAGIERDRFPSAQSALVAVVSEKEGRDTGTSGEEASNHVQSPADEQNRNRPNIDPKILDDSSDNDSASDASDDAPIGPALPETLQVEQDPLQLLELLPIQNEAVLGASHASYVSTIAIDRSGNRLVTGSIDSSVMLWDFNSMDRSLRSFKTVNPLDEAPVRNLQYSATGGLLLCSGGTNSAVILDRDGHVLSQTAKGDMYIVDMARTKGHTGHVLAATWRPGSASGKVFATSSADATVRLWNAATPSKVPMVKYPVMAQLRVTKLRTARGEKTIATAMDWCPDGKTCVVACRDGTLKVIDPDSYSMRPCSQSRVFMGKGNEVTSVTCAPESCHSPLVLVRSDDDCLRVFDRRSMQIALHELNNLPNAISETNACFVGANGGHFMTGTSADRKHGHIRGSLRMFETKTFKEVWKIETEEDSGSAVSVIWHKEVNQVLYGCGDGKVRVLYHPEESSKGVLQSLTRSDFRKKHGIASVGAGEVYLPSALYGRKGQINEGSGLYAKHSNRGRQEASEALKPKQCSGPKSVLSKPSQSLAKHLSAKDVSVEWACDPREAILRYADIAKKDPKFTNAYRNTQPETLLSEKTAEQEEEDTRKAIYERDMLRKARRTETER